MDDAEREGEKVSTVLIDVPKLDEQALHFRVCEQPAHGWQFAERLVSHVAIVQVTSPKSQGSGHNVKLVPWIL